MVGRGDPDAAAVCYWTRVSKGIWSVNHSFCGCCPPIVWVGSDTVARHPCKLNPIGTTRLLNCTLSELELCTEPCAHSKLESGKWVDVEGGAGYLHLSVKAHSVGESYGERQNGFPDRVHVVYHDRYRLPVTRRATRRSRYYLCHLQRKKGRAREMCLFFRRAKKIANGFLAA